MPEKKKKKARPPMPRHSEETPVHSLLGKAFGRLGMERSPAYPGDKKDKNLNQEMEKEKEE
ncbi:MAG: hypothetical protein V3V56_09170 [bacterium]